MQITTIEVGSYRLPILRQAIYERKEEHSTGQSIVTSTLNAKLDRTLITNWHGFPDYQPNNSLGLLPSLVIRRDIIIKTTCGKSILFYKANTLPLPLLTLIDKRGEVGDENHIVLNITLTTLI